MKTIFEFDDNNPAYYENGESCKLYAMQNAESLGFCIEQMLDKIRYYEKSDSEISKYADQIREDFLEIVNHNGINLERLGY